MVRSNMVSSLKIGRDWFDALVRSVLTSLANLVEWLFGCSHNRTTFPMTLRSETSIACLECGRRFGYDWSTMRITSQLPAGIRRLRGHALVPQVLR